MKVKIRQPNSQRKTSRRNVEFQSDMQKYPASEGWVYDGNGIWYRPVPKGYAEITPLMMDTICHGNATNHRGWQDGFGRKGDHYLNMVEDFCIHVIQQHEEAKAARRRARRKPNGVSPTPS